MPDNIEVPKEGLYVSTTPDGERLVVVDVNVVQDDEEGDEIFFLVTFVNEGDENDMSVPSWEFDSTEWREHVAREKLEFVG